METHSYHDDQLEERSVYFGHVIKNKSFFQLRESIFHFQCLQSNSDCEDSTGLRIYSASHVAIRFIASNSDFLSDKIVGEIGCGLVATLLMLLDDIFYSVGAVGLCCCACSNLKSLLLTDGNSSAIAIAEKNIFKLGMQNKANAQQLSWEEDFLGLNTSFDVIIGCELMYYKLDLPVLLSAVRRLLKLDGLFFHAHIFRAPNLERDLIAQMDAFGWCTLEIPLNEAVSVEELREHADWFNVRCLMSGTYSAIAELRNMHPSWIPFAEDIGDGRYGPVADSQDFGEAIGFGEFMHLCH